MSENQSKMKETQYSQEEIEKNKIWGILSYISVLFIVPLFIEGVKDSSYVKFHINQGLILFVGFIIIAAIKRLSIGLLTYYAGSILSIALTVLWIIGFVGAIQGQAKKVPLIGDIIVIK